MTVRTIPALGRRERKASGPVQAARGAGRHRLALLARRLLAVAIIVAVWEAAAGGFGGRFRTLNPFIVATPSSALADLAAYAQSGLLVSDLRVTFTAAFTGLLLGLLGGGIAGVVFGYWRALAETLEPVIVALNSLPRIAVAPLLIMWLGLGVTSKVFVSFFVVFFVVFFNAFLGTRSVDVDLVKALHAMGATRLQVTRLIVLPSVATWIFAALRTSVSFALTATITAEFVGSAAGLGYRLEVAAGLINTKRVFAILIVLMITGVVLVEIAKAIEGRLLRWRPAGLLES